MRPSISLLAIFLTCSLIAGPVVSETGFDRFFTDRRTRMQLDQAREQHSFISPRGNTPINNTEELVLPDVKFDGMIIRDDGSADIWINSTGSSQEEGLGDRVERSATRAKDGSVRVTLPTGKTVTLKPGQVYSMESERVREVYEGDRPAPPPGREDSNEEPAAPETANNSQSENEPEVAFDESALAEDQDTKIKLLEERVQKLEQVRAEN